MQNIINGEEYLTSRRHAPQDLRDFVNALVDKDLRSIVSHMTMDHLQWLLRWFLDREEGAQFGEVSAVQGLRLTWEAERKQADKQFTLNLTLAAHVPEQVHAQARDTRRARADKVYRDALRQFVMDRLTDPPLEWHP